MNQMFDLINMISIVQRRCPFDVDSTLHIHAYSLNIANQYVNADYYCLSTRNNNHCKLMMTYILTFHIKCFMSQHGSLGHTFATNMVNV